MTCGLRYPVRDGIPGAAGRRGRAVTASVTAEPSAAATDTGRRRPRRPRGGARGRPRRHARRRRLRRRPGRQALVACEQSRLAGAADGGRRRARSSSPEWVVRGSPDTCCRQQPARSAQSRSNESAGWTPAGLGRGRRPGHCGVELGADRRDDGVHADGIRPWCAHRRGRGRAVRRWSSSPTVPGFPGCRFPPGRPPRANLWALSVPLLVAAHASGRRRRRAGRLQAVADLLDDIADQCAPTVRAS